MNACERCATPIEAGDLRCSICGMATPSDLVVSAQTRVEVLRCDGCGAAMAYDVERQAPHCAFCGAVMHVEGIEDPMEQTEWFLSFSVEPTQAKAALRTWMGEQGFFTPSDLKETATIEQLRPLWWVGWVFEADLLVSWTADTNANTQRADWAPQAGQTRMRFDNLLVSASRGLSAAETHALSSAYNLSLGAVNAVGPEAPVIEQFDVQRSGARAAILDRVRAVAADRLAKEHLPGSRYRNLKLEPVLHGLITRRCAFPAYVLAYRYGGDLFRAVVHGQEVSVIVGRAPRSAWKIFLVWAGGFVALLLFLALFVHFAG